MAVTLLVVGGGRMGSALVEGLLRAEWAEPSALAVVAPSRETRAALAARFPGVAIAAGAEEFDLGPEAGAILAVKPDYAESVARVVGVTGVGRVLSVVAGLTTARLEAVLPAGVAVVRAMPNTPVVIGKGVTAIAGGSSVTSDDLEWAESILGSVGLVVRVAERHLDAVTGLSGPMPAYLYLVVESLIDAGVLQGLTREVSEQLVVAAFEGAGALLARSGDSPEVLRAQVTSPGGTTAAGLRVLEQRAVRAAFIDAVSAAAERSRQLGR